MTDTISRRDADDVERPDKVFPSTTTPTGLKTHARQHRGVDSLPSSSSTTGRFGRMFRHLPVFELEDLSLLAPIAGKMVSGGRPKDNPAIPSGYTYLGQFIDHDITFDPVSSLQRQNDPDGLHNFRTPRFDLDSVYGRGPADQPYLYDGLKLRLGESAQVNGPIESGGPDLPRTEPRERNGQPIFKSTALIGDPRNDENLIVSQLHVTFLKFHNRVVDHVRDTSRLSTDDNIFKEAQRLVRWHYQWVVVHDFLGRIVGGDVVSDVLREEEYVINVNGHTSTVKIPRPRCQFYTPQHDGYMPVEFAVAAYRIGHSMIRGRYHLNTFLRDQVGVGPFPIFGAEDLPANDLTNLNGFRRLPDDWGMDWQLFFEMPGSSEAPQPSLAIDTSIAQPLATLPKSVASDPPASLALRNLERGVRLGLPSGTSVALAMGIDPLSPTELGLTDAADEIQLHPPLWYYILREAEVLTAGQRLGPVGGRIVAEVLIGLLANDPLSYLNVQPGWRPTGPFADTDGTFGMPQLIRFALQR